MEDTNVAVLVDAKEEYTKQLVSILKTCIYQGIKSIYLDAKDICHQDNTPDNVLMIFQDLLSRIPKWSQDIINKEFERILNVSKCDYIDELIKVVYISHIKILSFVHSSQKNKKLSLKVPSGSHFIHLCYIECAREFWKDPYFLSDRGSKFEQQKNMRESENMIATCINETIRKQLPVRNILKDSLNEPDEDIVEAEDTDIKEPVTKKYLKKLETVVKKELKTTNMVSSIDIDLIRQVIREEIAGKILTNNIQKELIDNVVEKIVEKTHEINDTITNENDILNNSDKKNDTTDTNTTDTNTTYTNTTNSNDTTDTNINKQKKEVIISDKIDMIPIIPISNTEDKHTEDKHTEDKHTDIITNKVDEETINTSLENILNNNIEDNDDDDNDDDDDDVNIDNNNNNIDNIDNKIDNDNKTNISKQHELCINNIDEVNLNLDELDDNDCEEIDIDDLSLVNFNKKETENSNEVKKTENTKYIFFNDAK